MEPRPSSPLKTASCHARLADEGVETRIATTMFCDSCGYNLKGSPFAGRCSECGRSYDARRVLGENIYRPGTICFPGPECVACAGWWGLAWLAGALAIVGPWVPGDLLFGLYVLLALLIGMYASAATYEAVNNVTIFLRRRGWERQHAAVIAEEREAREQTWRHAAQQWKIAGRGAAERVRGAQFDIAAEGHEVTLNWPAMCATCGFGLRGQAKLGLCPACGTEYDAKPGIMLNVQSPHDAGMPWRDVLTALGCAALALGLPWVLFVAHPVFTVVCTVLFTGGAFRYAQTAVRRTRRYRRALEVLRSLGPDAR